MRVYGRDRRLTGDAWVGLRARGGAGWPCGDGSRAAGCVLRREGRFGAAACGGRVGRDGLWLTLRGWTRKMRAPCGGPRGASCPGKGSSAG